jgi:hypothetical protein
MPMLVMDYTQTRPSIARQSNHDRVYLTALEGEDLAVSLANSTAQLGQPR